MQMPLSQGWGAQTRPLKLCELTFISRCSEDDKEGWLAVVSARSSSTLLASVEPCLPESQARSLNPSGGAESLTSG